MPTAKQLEDIAIDINHAALISALVSANKPTKILEVGYGSGRSCEAILRGLDYNEQPYEYTVVDCWADYEWGGKVPHDILKKYEGRVNFVTDYEEHYIKSIQNKTYNFCVLDADHHRTQEWFEYVYDNLLEENGILIYHDVNLFEDKNQGAFENLREIYYKCKEKGYQYHLFNKSSLSHERCIRGLLVIFKH